MKLLNPRVPVSIPIENRLVPGSKVVITGWPTEKCNQININLKFGPNDEEIALHISIRFRPSVKIPVVVRNHLTSAGWGQEEKETPHFPFLVKERYKLEILCERARFQIFVDGRLLAKFTHRLPLAYVNWLEVQGDTEITYIEIPSGEFVDMPNVNFESTSIPVKLNNLSIG